MKWLFISLLLLASPVKAQDELTCLHWVIHKEARGETTKVQRAVVDVVMNRAKLYGIPICDVIKQRGQFPYVRFGIKLVDRKLRLKYNDVIRMCKVLDSRYLYFNHKKHKWGKGTLKIGNLYFSR